MMLPSKSSKSIRRVVTVINLMQLFGQFHMVIASDGVRNQLILRLYAGINVVIGDSVRIRSILSCNINVYFVDPV